MIRRWIGLNCVALLAALGVSGCIVEITFDPVGTDATIAGSWTIEGAAPTAESCAELGITHVKVRFYDGALGYDHPDLVFPCAQGSFDTRPDAVVADGVWDIALVAVNNGTGNEIVMSEPVRYDTIEAGGHIQLDLRDFSAAMMVTALEGTWTVNMAAPTADSCAAIGVTEVHVQFLDDAGNPGTDTLKLDCAAGGFRIEDIAPGAYSVRLAAVNASTTIAMSEAQAVTVTDGMTATVPNIDFSLLGFDPTGTDAALKASWIIGGSDADIAEQCAAVGATNVTLMFYAPDDTAGEAGVAIDLGPCDAGTYDSVTPTLAAGDYLIDAQLTAADGTLISVRELGTLTVTAGTPLDAGPIDFRLTTSTVMAMIQWEIPNGDESAGTGAYGSCADAGAVAVNWQLRDGSNATVLMGTEDEACAATIAIDAAALAAGSYSLYYDGEDDAGRKAWMPNGSGTASCEGSLDGEAGGLAVLVCEAMFTP